MRNGLIEIRRKCAWRKCDGRKRGDTFVTRDSRKLYCSEGCRKAAGNAKYYKTRIAPLLRGN